MFKRINSALLALALLVGVALACKWTQSNSNNSNEKPKIIAGGDTKPATVTRGERSVFFGSIDYSNRIQMGLVREGDKLTGAYSYVRVGQNLDVSGTIDAQGNVVLNEFDKNGMQTGVFNGRWKEPDSTSSVVRIEGTWKKASGGKELEFTLYQQPIEFRDDLKIATKLMKDNNKQKRYDVDVAYPQIEGTPTSQMLAFNSHISAEMRRMVNDWKKGAGRDPNEKDTVPEAGDDSLSVDYEVQLANEDLISIRFTISTYGHGAAHPNSGAQVTNFDLKSGREIKPSDIFAPGANYLKALSDYCIRDLKKRKMEDTNEPLLDEEQIKSGAAPEESNYSNWNITKRGILVTFDPYQVGPYAVGPQEVIVPWAVLKPVMRSDSPLAKLAE